MEKKQILEQIRFDEKEKLRGMGVRNPTRKGSMRKPRYGTEGHSRNGEPMENIHGRY